MNKTLLTVFKVILHVVGWPLLIALVFILNRNVIAGGSMYGLAVFVCVIVAAVMASASSTGTSYSWFAMNAYKCGWMRKSVGSP